MTDSEGTSPVPSPESASVGSSARIRSLTLISALVLVASATAVGVFATLNRRAAIAAMTEQMDAFVRVTVGTVEIGLSSGQVGEVRSFLTSLSESPLFGGATLFSEDFRPILSIPEDFYIGEQRRARVMEIGELSEGSLTYRAASLAEDDGEVLGHLVIAVSREPLEEGARQALLGMLLAGSLLLLPTVGAIGWLLTRMERELRSQEGRLREAQREIEIQAQLRRSQEEKASLEARLRHSQKMETLGTLAGGIAHDFNNLLTPIIGFADVAQDEVAESSSIRSDLEKITHSALRARDLVSQLLAFSRQQEQDFKSCRPQDIVSEVLQLIPMMVPSTLDVHSEVDENSPRIYADPAQIHQVLMNLCINASHAVGSRPGTLFVGLESCTVVDGALLARNPSAEPGSFVKITTRDTGVGMDAETASRIFEPFYTTKKVGEGTGLGLSVAHGIITAHRGMITVDSEVGRGTTIEVYLPTMDADAAAEISDGTATGVAHEVLKDGGEARGRVMIVDDEVAVGTYMARVLERFGYQVETFSDPEAARADFAANPGAWDLVLTDQTMPHLSGLDLARQIKEVRHDIPILIATGYSRDIEAGHWRAAGISGVLAKPIGMRDLVDAVEEVLEGPGS